MLLPEKQQIPGVSWQFGVPVFYPLLSRFCLVQIKRKDKVEASVLFRRDIEISQYRDLFGKAGFQNMTDGEIGSSY